MIEFTNVTLKQNGRTILDQVSFQWKIGQTHVLLGASGSGKTTLLRLLLGLAKPDAGEISVSGCTFGYIPQQGGLFPHLTAKQNVTLGAEAHRWSWEKIEKRWAETFPLLQLNESLINRYPRELSGGEVQRFAILRAIFMDPAVLALDEPFGALDPITRSQMQEDFKKLFNRLNKTVVIVTHDLAEAAFFGHTISVLHQGQLLQTGPFEELRDHPRHPYVSEFIQAHRPLELP